ncbi:protein pigeon-like isoform X10 [Dreissena polymorpha]|uniref:protein pigeon-like isoform X10 n=1 Tax=Dreissena polymorpha TaxID=45954 RepID=UPI0022651848|nr:protein pigeon-like isoform X10 [Dreissena polymorpha]
MIELKKIRNLRDEIDEFIASRNSKLKAPYSAHAKRGVHLLNQEKDGGIIFTWEEVSEANEGSLVTHFGLYNAVSKNFQVIHVYNQPVSVVSASVNQSQTLLAFTTVSRNSTSSSTERSTGKETYNAYLAEIKAANPRVFSLNLERHTFIKVQFLFEDKPVEKETYMLVMLHRESIGLYKIPLARAANGMVMRGQPNTEQIGKKFVWCQWDSSTQTLFYIHKRKDPNNQRPPMLTCIQLYSNAHHENVLDVPLNFPITRKLSGRCSYADIPFCSGIPDTTINACVLTLSNGTFCLCYQSYVGPPERRSKSSPLPRTSPLQRSSPLQQSGSYQRQSSETDSAELNYYVCMVHHAKTLHGCVSNIPEHMQGKATLSFAWHVDTILVTLPGYFVHILNVSIEFEPCNHILLHSKSYLESVETKPEEGSTSAAPGMQGATGTGVAAPGKMPLEVGDRVAAPGNVPLKGGHGVTAPGNVPLEESHRITAPGNVPLEGGQVGDDSFLPMLHEGSESLVLMSSPSLVNVGAEGPLLVDRLTGCVYSVSVNMAKLIQTFTNCHMPLTRAALLNYVIIKQKNFTLTKQLFAVVCNDIPSPEVPTLMMEFLIAQTYVGMRRQVDREALRLLPFTHTEPFRGQFDKTQSGERLVRVSYSPIESVNIMTKSARERQQKKSSVADDWLDMLRRHLHWMQVNKTRRFNFEMLKKPYQQMQREEEKKNKVKEEESFITKIRIRKSDTQQDSEAVGHYGSKSDTILGTAPHFLQGNRVTEASETLMNLTTEVLSKHMLTYLLKDGKVKANTAKDYVSCQQTQSRLLCHLLWTLRGQHLGHPEDSSLPSLCMRADVDEYELFQLLERYWMTARELYFPVPLGFHAYFACLAFRCLHFRMFLQYVRHGIVPLTGDFMAQLITELPDVEEYVQLKRTVILQLSLSEAEECYQLWGHISCNTYLAHSYVDKILAEQRPSLDTSSLDSTPLQQRARTAILLKSPSGPLLHSLGICINLTGQEPVSVAAPSTSRPWRKWPCNTPTMRPHTTWGQLTFNVGYRVFVCILKVMKFFCFYIMCGLRVCLGACTSLTD